jgi:hypothetical protein
MAFWHSPSFPVPPVEQSTLAGRLYQTDVLDHTLLGLMGVSGDYYDPRKDILSTAFEPVPRMIPGQPQLFQPVATAHVANAPSASERAEQPAASLSPGMRR